MEFERYEEIMDVVIGDGRALQALASKDAEELSKALEISEEESKKLLDYIDETKPELYAQLNELLSLASNIAQDLKEQREKERR